VKHPTDGSLSPQLKVVVGASNMGYIPRVGSYFQGVHEASKGTKARLAGRNSSPLLPDEGC